MELFLTVVFTAMLLCRLLFIPAFLGILSLNRRFQTAAKRRLRRIAAAVLAVTIVWSTVTTLHPPILWQDTPADKAAAEEIIRYVSDGPYFDRLPLFLPVLVTAETTPHNGLRWQTHYLPFVSTEHIYSDTYECTEYLFPWS